jgi:hypothetical protein
MSAIGKVLNGVSQIRDSLNDLKGDVYVELTLSCEPESESEDAAKTAKVIGFKKPDETWQLQGLDYSGLLVGFSLNVFSKVSDFFICTLSKDLIKPSEWPWHCWRVRSIKILGTGRQLKEEILQVLQKVNALADLVFDYLPSLSTAES